MKVRFLLVFFLFLNLIICDLFAKSNDEDLSGETSGHPVAKVSSTSLSSTPNQTEEIDFETIPITAEAYIDLDALEDKNEEGLVLGNDIMERKGGELYRIDPKYLETTPDIIILPEPTLWETFWSSIKNLFHF